jgi:hypothetical protein
MRFLSTDFVHTFFLASTAFACYAVQPFCSLPPLFCPGARPSHEYELQISSTTSHTEARAAEEKKGTEKLVPEPSREKFPFILFADKIDFNFISAFLLKHNKGG